MRAMILAAGRGERMRPLTDKMPKSMLEVSGKPLIQYHVENLVQAGIVDIVINHALFGEQIETHLNDGKSLGASIRYSAEGDHPLETAGGIVKALPLLGDKPFVTVNADIWTDFPFQSLLREGDGQADDSANNLAHIILVDNPEHNPNGDFALSDGKVLNQGELMLTFSGISVFKPEFFKDCTSGSVPLTPILRQASSQGQVMGSHYQGRWQDIGTPERLNNIRQSYKHK
ncbi:MAG: mannose-1-phosphate guanylyltransferase [Gammaproteobacteria bacterium]|nr:MAG: mannose-1-phosphate guanylyltransferase [Gammaproteobacteria bacterium]RKZ72027.1 MAG: mannose-1-phosphate guanylyltransferase [Gammaproteobacteria bacterium]